MGALEAKGRRIAAYAAERASVRLAAAMRTQLPHARITVEPGQIVVTGSPKLRFDPALRWPGGLLK